MKHHEDAKAQHEQRYLQTPMVFGVFKRLFRQSDYSLSEPSEPPRLDGEAEKHRKLEMCVDCAFI